MKPAYVAMGLLAAAVGGLWYFAGGPAPASLLAREGLSVTPAVSHENLTVFFLRGPDKVDDSKVVTLQEALERGWAVMNETGSVNQLTVENRSDDQELFLQSGDIIKGGKQDRMIASDLLVPPKSGAVPVPSHCVEKGRWTGREGEAATHFAVSNNFAVGNDLKFANAAGDQGRVWQNVEKNQKALCANLGVEVRAKESPTSLQLALDNEAVQRSIADFERSLLGAGREQAGVVGAVFVVNGQVTSAEVYGSNGLFRKAWPKLLKSAAVEAVATKASDEPRKLTAAEVEGFLLASFKASAEEPALSVTAGSPIVTNPARTGDVIREVADLIGPADNVDGDQAVQVLTGRSMREEPLQRSLYGNALYQNAEAYQERSLDNLRGHGLARPMYRQAAQPSAGQAQVNAIDNSQSLHLETRIPDRGNAVLHRSVFNKK